MDNNEIKRYKDEMMKMYGRVHSVNKAAVEPLVNAAPTPSVPNPPTTDMNSATGGLIGVATSVRGLYFVPNAKVTVFKGDIDNMEVIDTDITNQNGRTKELILETPLKSESFDSANTEIPYSLYNMMFEADGYLTNIHLNIPVFPTVTSRQTSNLLLLETAGVDKGPRIFDESQKYEL